MTWLWTVNQACLFFLVSSNHCLLLLYFLCIGSRCDGGIYVLPTSKAVIFIWCILLASYRYMKYLYLYECEKKSLSSPAELQAAIDGNRREGRRPSYGTSSFNYSPTPGGPNTLLAAPKPPVAMIPVNPASRMTPATPIKKGQIFSLENRKDLAVIFYNCFGWLRSALSCSSPWCP